MATTATTEQHTETTLQTTTIDTQTMLHTDNTTHRQCYTQVKSHQNAQALDDDRTANTETLEKHTQAAAMQKDMEKGKENTQMDQRTTKYRCTTLRKYQQHSYKHQPQSRRNTTATRRSFMVDTRHVLSNAQLTKTKKSQPEWDLMATTLPTRNQPRLVLVFHRGQ